MSEVLDSYTGEPYVEEYVSQIPNIRQGRQAFWKREHYLRAAEQYWAYPVTIDPAGVGGGAGPGATDSGAALDSTPDPRFRDPRPSGWLLRRKNSPPDLFPLLATESKARAAMDWCVQNDASIAIVIHWLLKGNVVPFLAMLEDLVEITKNA